MNWLMTLALAADLGGTAILDSELTAAERDGAHEGVRAAGLAVLSDAEVGAAVDALAEQGITCAVHDVSCLAKIALLAEAEAVVTFVRAPAGLQVRAVDAGPRVGSALALSSSPDDVARATSIALATRVPLPSAPPPPAQGRAPEPTTPRAPEASVPEANMPDTDVLDARVGPDARVPDAHAPSPSASGASAAPGWSLAGAGLAGAGLVALAAGGYAAALATDSMQSAEGARFQDDAARFGNEANTRLWLGGGAIALGVGAVAGGAALVFGGGP